MCKILDTVGCELIDERDSTIQDLEEEGYFPDQEDLDNIDFIQKQSGLFEKKTVNEIIKYAITNLSDRVM